MSNNQALSSNDQIAANDIQQFPIVSILLVLLPILLTYLPTKIKSDFIITPICNLFQ